MEIYRPRSKRHIPRRGLLGHNPEGRANSLHYAGSVNMPRLFAVKGRPRSGKGKTIREVYKKLLATFPDAKHKLFQRSANGRDICAVLNIGGTMIGIESNNHHPEDRTERSLKLFLSKRCDVIVCATLTRGCTVEAVKNRFAGREITWLHLPKPASKSAREQACRAKADEIFHEVCAIVK